MSLHATLSPSSAERWISCPASIRMVEGMRDEESIYAQEGTAAHALAEIMARYHILKTLDGSDIGKVLAGWRKEYNISSDAEAEMTEHAAAYVSYLKERLVLHPGAQLLLEQRLPTGVPDSWGTSDAVLVDPTTVEIVDFKYGLGVRVEAAGNPQLRLYGVGALEAFGDLLGDVEEVRCTVFQPRLDHVDTEVISAADLRAWRDSLIPIAESALGPDAPFGPSEAACRWCPASGQCKAQMEWATQRDFGVEPETLTAEEVAEALDQIPAIKAWCAAVEAYSLDRAYSQGKPIPGYKVVMSGGKRSVKYPVEALEALVGLGYEPDEVSERKVKGIGDLEKLLGKPIFKQVLEEPGYVQKGAGSPSLVPESDSRPAIDPEGQAAEDFQ